MTEKLFYARMRLARRFPAIVRMRSLLYARSVFVQPLEIFGKTFPNPLGSVDADPDGLYASAFAGLGFGCVISGPFHPGNGKRSIQEVISGLRPKRSDAIIGVTLSRRAGDVEEDTVLDDFRIPFTLFYDFVDFFVIDMEAPEIDSMAEILDEILSIRLSYEQSLPLLLRLPAKTPQDELEAILSYCMLSGIDGVLAEGADLIMRISSITRGRLAIAGISDPLSPEKALAMRAAGASLLLMGRNQASQGLKTPVRILKALRKNAKHS